MKAPQQITAGAYRGTKVHRESILAALILLVLAMQARSLDELAQATHELAKHFPRNGEVRAVLQGSLDAYHS